mmetsp:Transcript_4128/g.6267  ORF Transcript_4128/g.6267 Transcript_4128/m.6267 type:complete len:81 (-) Transcript_4128:113-355(-)
MTHITCKRNNSLVHVKKIIEWSRSRSSERPLRDREENKEIVHSQRSNKKEDIIRHIIAAGELHDLDSTTHEVHLNPEFTD